MRRTLLGIAIASALVAGLLAAGGASARGGTTSCHLTPHQQRTLGASYVTSLKVRHTSCAKGRAVTLAFNRCRTAGGKPQGKCRHRVGHYACTEHRYDAVPHVQYSSRVTCAWGRKRVLSTYTQNT